MFDHKQIQKAAHAVKGLQNICSGGYAVSIAKGMGRCQFRLPGHAPGSVQPKYLHAVLRAGHKMGLTVKILRTVAAKPQLRSCHTAQGYFRDRFCQHIAAQQKPCLLQHLIQNPGNSK